jgi:hypothetical protein
MGLPPVDLRFSNGRHRRLQIWRLRWRAFAEVRRAACITESAAPTHVRIDLAQGSSFYSQRTVGAMNKPDELDQDKPRPKPSRAEEALRIIEEYANGLREIIKKLRQRLD